MTEALQYSLKSGSLIPPVADSFLYMAEPINIVKFKNKIKFKKEEEKEKKMLWELALSFLIVKSFSTFYYWPVCPF